MGIRQDWYQSDQRIILALLIKGTTEVDVNFQAQAVIIKGKDSGKFNQTLLL